MLFAISGSQGSGKSTVMNSLRDRGFPVVERKTSRSIMEEWGVTLSEVNNDRELTVKFQDEILNRKFADEKQAALSPSTIWFTERTYADLFTYALIAIGKDNEYSKWLDEYYQRCMHYQATYSHIFYLPAGKFKVQSDGVRGANGYYSKLVDRTMYSTTVEMAASVDAFTFESTGPFVTKVLSSEVEHRTQEILSHISEYFTKPKKLLEAE